MIISLRVAEQMDCKFLLECFNFCHEINDRPNKLSLDSDLQTIKNILNPLYPDQDLIIVNNGVKDIGFFSQDLDFLSLHLGASCYIHPQSCKMSILRIVRASAIRGYIYISKNAFEYVELNTWNSLIVTTVLKVIPVLKVFKLHDKYKIMFASCEDVLNSSECKANIDKYNVRNITKEIVFEYDDQ